MGETIRRCKGACDVALTYALRVESIISEWSSVKSTNTYVCMIVSAPAKPAHERFAILT